MTLEEAVQHVEAELEQQCAELTGPMREACRYATQGGRRVRATLLLGAAEGNPHRAVKAAAAVELIHAATLLQDDIFDAGSTRRGRLTAHLKFGRALAILASDWLLIRALELAADVHPRFFRTLARAGSAMAQAEADELEGALHCSIEEAQRIGNAIARGKTAMLFGACLCGAAILQGVSGAECSQWEELGIAMGMTYQLVDDCVDVYGNTAASGKTGGGDLAAGRLTMPLLLAAAALRERGIELSPEMLQAGRLQSAESSLLRTALHTAEVRVQLASLVQRRLLDHRRDAHRAGIADSAVELWCSELSAQLATCFPGRMQPGHALMVVGGEGLDGERSTLALP